MGFALEHLTKSKEFWRNVVYSDEKTFSSAGMYDKFVYRKKGTRFENKNIIKSKKSGRVDVCLWGYITGYGVGELVEVDGTLNSEKYINILKEHLIPSLKMLAPENSPYYFLQDNSPIHKSKIVMDWIENCEDLILIKNWPARSPDLNPIENLWAYMARKWDNNIQKSRKSVVNQAITIWESLRGSPEFTEKLADSMPNRLLKVIEANGSVTKY